MESNRQVAMTMNHNNEPRKTSTGSRTPQDWVKAEGRRLPRTTVMGIVTDRRGLRGRHDGK